MSGSPMSMSISSGRNARASRSAGLAGVGDADVVTPVVQPQRQALGDVLVVVDDQNLAAPRRRARGRASRSSSRTARPSLPTAAAGGPRRCCPGPAPRWTPVTVPPCISTKLRTSVRPMPSPPCDRPCVAVRLREEVEHLGDHAGRDADAVVGHRDADPLAARPAAGLGSALDGDARSARASGVNLAALLSRFEITWARRVASPSTRSRSAGPGQLQVLLARLDHRAGRLDGARHDRIDLHRLAGRG